MGFKLTEQQELIKRSIRRFSEDILSPLAPIIDERAEFSWEIVEALEKINAWGIQLPEKYGGVGLDSISYTIIIEEISRICASTGVTVSVHNSLGAHPILKWGSKEQKEKYLYKIADGKILTGFSWTEPNAGSDAGGIECTAIQEGDDFILNGSKIFVTNGGIASVFIVGARYITNKGEKGIAAFIVEKKNNGIEIGPNENKMGMRGSSTTTLDFNDYRIPKENILGDLANGFKIAMNILDVGRIGIGAQSVGIAQAAFEQSVKYSKSRIQFKRPISRFQGISFKLAEMATKIDAARLLVYRAAFLKDHSSHFSKEAAMCKYFSSKIARQITQEAIQIHGGYGYMKDLPLERYYRDAKACEIYEGTNEILKLVIAQQILKNISF
ncbi:MAG: acyl-CoA dehydrogenase family protein [Promethearchaeota archaeon]